MIWQEKCGIILFLICIISFVRINYLPFYKNWMFRSFVRQRRNPKETANLTSIQDLVAEIDKNCHAGSLLVESLNHMKALVISIEQFLSAGADCRSP